VIQIRRFIFGVTAVILGIIMLCFMPGNSTYRNLWILVFTTGIFFFVPCGQLFGISKYITLLIESCIILRNIIAPALLVISDYSAEISSFTKESFDLAIILILLETLCILLVVARMTNRISNESKRDNERYDIEFRCGRLFKSILLILLLICIICIYLNSSILTAYTATWRINNETARMTKQVDTVYTIFSLCFEILKMMIIVFGFSLLVNKKDSWIKTVLIAVLIGIPALFTSENYGYILINIVVSSVFAVSVFPKQNRRLMVSTVLMFVLLFIGIFAVKGSTTSKTNINIFKDLSTFLQGYLGGVTNVAGASKLVNIDKTICLFYDIYFMVPFRNSLFGIPGDYRSTVFFNSVNGVNSQIIPCISQGYLYLSFVTVIFSALLIYSGYSIIIKMNNRINIASDYIYLFVIFYFVLTPFMYNYTILGSWLLMVLVPAMLVFRAANKFYFSRSRI